MRNTHSVEMRAYTSDLIIEPIKAFLKHDATLFGIFLRENSRGSACTIKKKSSSLPHIVFVFKMGLPDIGPQCKVPIVLM